MKLRKSIGGLIFASPFLIVLACLGIFGEWWYPLIVIGIGVGGFAFVGLMFWGMKIINN